MSPDPFGPEEFQRAANVSRETVARLERFVGLLEERSQRQNLVSRRSLGEVWRRHIWDSAQLTDFVPAGAASLVDLGSGAGFPGLILAALRPKAIFRTVLYEATRKKCEFLADAARLLEITVEIRNDRLEAASPEIFDVVTARACAPLPRLLLYAQAFQGKHTRNLFLKGQNVGAELTETHKSWKMTVQQNRSRSDASGTILVIEGLRHAG